MSRENEQLTAAGRAEDRMKKTLGEELIEFGLNRRSRGEYLDRKYFSTLEEQTKAKEMSNTAYIGNLSFYTSETQIYEFFSQAGVVQKVIMGLNKKTKKPCGFCFIVFADKSSLLDAAKFLNGLFLDGKRIKVEVDPGFREGRQYGRGERGSQKLDERRYYVDYLRPDPTTSQDQPQKRQKV